MRMRAVFAILSVVLAVSAPDAAGAADATLTGVRYSVRGGESTLRILLVGTCSYSLVPEANGVAIVLAGTRVGSPPGAARLTFASGGIGRVAVRPLKGDSARICLTLRGTPAYTVSRTREGIEFRTAAAGEGAKPVTAAPTGVQILEGVRVIDIPSTVFAEARGTQPAPDPGASARRVPTQRGDPVIAPVPLAVAAGVSAFGTTALLLMIGLRLRLLPVSGGTAPPATANRDEAETDSEDETGPAPAPERAGGEEHDGCTGGTDDPPGVTGAFASLKLHDTAWSSTVADRVRAISSSGRSGAGKLREARRHGVGLGELELAAGLQRCERRSRRKEGEQ
jgi:hypothetical protein